TDVKYNVHVWETNIPNRRWIGYTAVCCAKIAGTGFGGGIRTHKEVVFGRDPIWCHHFHHQLERPRWHACGQGHWKYGETLIRNVDRSGGDQKVGLPVATWEWRTVVGIEIHGQRLSFPGTAVGLLDPERNRHDVVLPATSKRIHVKGAPVM